MHPDLELRPAWTLLAVSLAVSVVLLGTTILNVALPELRVALPASNTQQQWILNSYTLTFAGFLLLAGAIGDRFGLRRTLVVGLSGFTATTLASAFASNATMLIALRGITGVFAAAIMPISLAVVVRTFPKDKVPGAIAVWAAVSGLAIALGPLIGGALLTAGYWWGSVLLVVALLGLSALVLTVLVVRTPVTAGDSRIRLIPVVGSVSGIGLLVWGVLHGGQSNQWTSAGTLVPMAAGVGLLAALVFSEGRHKDPLADVRLFLNRRFSVAVAALSLGTFTVYGFLYFSTFYLQVARGYSPLRTGLLLLPLSVGLIVGGLASRRIAAKLGTPTTMTIGMALTAGSLAFFALLAVSAPIGWFTLIVFVLAFGFALVLSPGTTMAMTSVPPGRDGAGSALINTLRQLASALGVSILGSILWSKYRSNVAPGLAGMSPTERESASSSLAASIASADGNSAIIDAAQSGFESALHVTTWVAAAIVLVAALLLPIITYKNRSVAS